MLENGDTAPPFAVPAVTPDTTTDRGSYTSADVTEFRVDETLAEGPIVLAFVPGVYSRTCTEELCQLRDWVADLTDLAATVYGVSADTPWSQLAFLDEYDLNYPMLSGFNNDLLASFGVRVEEGVLRGIARRSVFVLDAERTVRYSWATDESLTYPDLDAIAEAVEAAEG